MILSFDVWAQRTMPFPCLESKTISLTRCKGRPSTPKQRRKWCFKILENSSLGIMLSVSTFNVNKMYLFFPRRLKGIVDMDFFSIFITHQLFFSFKDTIARSTNSHSNNPPTRLCPLQTGVHSQHGRSWQYQEEFLISAIIVQSCDTPATRENLFG